MGRRLKQATISHELGHVARRDVWVDYAIQILACGLWWHPLIRKVTTTVTRLRELACDEWVLQSSNVSPRRYAHSLLEIIQRCQIEPLPLTAPMSVQGDLENRIVNISSPNRSKKIHRFWIASCVIGVLLIAGAIAVVTLEKSNQQNRSLTTIGAFGDIQPPSDLSGSKITGLVTHMEIPYPGSR